MQWMQLTVIEEDDSTGTDCWMQWAETAELENITTYVEHNESFGYLGLQPIETEYPLNWAQLE